MEMRNQYTINDVVTILNKRFESIDKRFDVIDKRFVEIDKRFDTVDRHFKEVCEYIDGRFIVESKRREEQTETIITALDDMFGPHEKRLNKLEATVRILARPA